MQSATLLALSGCLVSGLALGLIGTLKLHLTRPLSGPPLAFRRLFTLGNLAFVVLLLLAAVLMDTLGPWWALTGGSILLALGLFALGLGNLVYQTNVLALVAGLGAVSIYLATLQLMPRGVLGEREVAASMLFGFVFIGLTSMMVPPLFEVLRAGMGLRNALTVLALLTLAPGVLATLPFTSDAFPPHARTMELGTLISSPRLWLAGLVFAFYAPLEAFISVWTTTYLNRQKQADQAARWIACFWASLLASRVLFGLIQHVFALQDSAQPLFLVVPALLAAVVLGNMSGSTTADQALSGLVMLGLFLGPVLPMLLANLFGMPATTSAPAMAVALLYTCGAAGSLVLSPLVAYSAEAGSLQKALRVPLVVALLLTAAALLFALTSMLS